MSAALQVPNPNQKSYTLRRRYREGQLRRVPYSLRLINSALMKSLASWETASNASSSKSNSAFVMLVNVSGSLSPMNGDRPDSLKTTESWKSKTPHTHERSDGERGRGGAPKGRVSWWSDTQRSLTARSRSLPRTTCPIRGRWARSRWSRAGWTRACRTALASAVPVRFSAPNRSLWAWRSVRSATGTWCFPAKTTILLLLNV